MKCAQVFSLCNKMSVTLILFLLILKNPCKVESSPAALTHLLVTRVGPCFDNTAEDIVAVSEMALHRELYHFSFSGWMNVTEDVENGWQVKATVQKCHDIRNLDTCDYYKSVMVVRDGCLNSEQEDLYIKFFQYVTPKLECPIRAGFYRITDFPFFTEDTGLTAVESKISTSVFGYTYRLEAFIEDETRVFCTEAYLRMMYLRKHDWIGDQTISNYKVEETTEATVPRPAKTSQTDVQNDNKEVVDGRTDDQTDNVAVGAPSDDEHDEDGGKDDLADN